MDSKNKILAIIEVVVVFAVTLTIMGWVSNTALGEWERTVLGRFFILYALMIAIPILILLLSRRKLVDYGISLRNFKYHLDIALTCFLPYAIVMILTYYIDLGSEAANALLDVVLTGVLVLVVGWMLRKKRSQGAPGNLGDSRDPDALSGAGFSGGPALMLLVLVFSPALAPLEQFSVGKALSALAYYTLFLGPGEEILFRGYIQSRLNEAFGRPFRFQGIPWGWGLLITSLLFGLFHVLNLVSLFKGIVDFNGWAMTSFVWGLFFGIIREKTASVVAPALLHGVPQGMAWAFFGL